MRTLARFGGILTTLGLFFGLFVLGFATSQPGLLFMALLCVWPFLWACTAWTVRGLRDHYQLVPKGQPASPTLTSSPQRRSQRPAIPQEDFS